MVQSLRTLAEGGATYRVIAEKLSREFAVEVTPRAVASKASRLRIPLRGRYIAPKKARAHDKSGDRVLPAEPAPEGFQFVFKGPAGQRELAQLVPVLREVVIEGGVSLLEKRLTQCSWPLWGDDEKPVEYRFCGVSIEPTQTYCACHRALAYVKPMKRAQISEEVRLARRIAQLRRWMKAGVRA